MASPARPNLHVVESPAADIRLARVRAFVEQHLSRGDVLLVGPSRGCVDDLARRIAAGRGATLGLHRFSLTQLAARLAAPLLAAHGVAPATALGADAVAARAAFDARAGGALAYFGPVAATPGFPRALARTLQELRLAGVSADRLAQLPLGGRDLAALLERFEEQFAAASATDRAALLGAATDAMRAGTPLVADSVAIALVDVPLESAGETDFVAALADGRDALLTIPFGDITTLNRVGRLGVTPEVVPQQAPTDLAALRRSLFAERQPPEREPAGDVRFFSAPGEGRECVEIARRVMHEAAAGVPFDEIAIFVRSPDRYAGLLEHALKRAGIPAYFDRGTRRPHPAGRAFLAILACACEKLSARRFAEYLSLAQVPAPADRRTHSFVVPDEDESFLPGQSGIAEPLDVPEPPEGAEAVTDGAEAFADDESIVEGSLRAPWKWETLIVESAVIGGEPARWHRRLSGLAEQYRIQLAAERRDDPESPRAARIERDIRNLAHLRAFALPVIDRLARWPASATWGEWLDRFTELAPVVLRYPDRVLRVLAGLRPMSAIGPVSLDEARAVVADRLLVTETTPPKSRYGRVFVGGAPSARGRQFRVVFAAGLAERLFPQRPHEDPMLLDAEMRVPLAAGLATQTERVQTERLLLRLAVGAPTERLWLSYPRIEIAESRPRVPSTYALDVMRAVTGRVPKYQALEQSAASAGGSWLAWPAPVRPDDAIDDLEHDLAVLKELLLVDTPAMVRGHAHYLLRLNEHLKRSVSARWSRGRSQWTPFDGITRVTGMTRPMLTAQRLAARPYSLSALQKFAACPYQFLLAAIYRLEPPPEIEPLQKLDPLTRGSIFHDCQARFFRQLDAEGRLPVQDADVPHALGVMDDAIARVAARYEEDLVPAIDRVWRDEIADIARDLRVWVRRLPGSGGWTPRYFEYAFGLHDDNRDPRSRAEAVLVDGRFLLRGSVDLIEQKAAALRVTDHKTGKNRTTWKTVVGGGAILQPVLYSLAVEQALGAPVTSGRLFYCTSAGGFTDHEIPINETTRRLGLEALEIVDRAVELGFLPAAPAERACTWCDFRPVCGPDEYERTRHKSQDHLSDLDALRKLP